MKEISVQGDWSQEVLPLVLQSQRGNCATFFSSEDVSEKLPEDKEQQDLRSSYKYTSPMS